jgi:two-component system chemotaxis response regulator CheB
MLAQDLKPKASAAQIRVMVVDDSAIVRGFVTRILEETQGITVVATCSNGQAAVQQAARLALDVIVLDIEMPVMDGLTAVPKILEANPNARIVMASTLTQRNASVSLDAMALGASDYIAKPSTAGISTHSDFRRELIEKVFALGKPRAAPSPAAVPGKLAPPPVLRAPAAPIRLRPSVRIAPQVLVIGSSTGGPQALMTLVQQLPSSFRLPIAIAQHMPATFTTVLAQHVGRAAKRHCKEATHNDALEPGSIYLAPGGYHLQLARCRNEILTQLNQAPPENFCRPSVNPLFRSAAQVFGANVLAVMLTGMGHDGLDGTRELANIGAHVVAQDEASSVVWGMPGAIATAGLCNAVLPLGEIPAHLVAASDGARR